MLEMASANVPFTFHICCSLRIDESGLEERVLIFDVTVKTCENFVGKYSNLLTLFCSCGFNISGYV